MIEIITSEITEDIKSFLLESLSFLKCGITKNFIEHSSNDKTIMYIVENNEIVSFCIYSAIDKQKLVYDLESSCDHFDSDAFGYFCRYINDIPDSAIYLHFVESIKEGCGYGTKIIKELTTLEKEIFLYSVLEAEEFWEKNNFVNIFGYNYTYTEN